MGKYVRRFLSVSAYTQARENDYLEPWVSAIDGDGNGKVDYNKTEEERRRELRKMPLTFEVTGDGNIVWYATSSANTRAIEYNKNGGGWTQITSSRETPVIIPVISGDSVQFRGDNASYGLASKYYNTFSGSTCEFNLKGNVMSLINSTDFETLSGFSAGTTYNLIHMFGECPGLTRADDLILSAETLTMGCYQLMFNLCTSLVAGPDILTTTASQACCYNMFVGCSSLTTAPALPATTLADNCYGYMFSGCTSLTIPPELPAQTLANNCYTAMFQYCGSLTTTPKLHATTLANYCYSAMFNGCTSLTEAPVLPATTLRSYCYQNMFNGCTGLTSAPELPAETLATYCYNGMFNGCTSLTEAPVLPATTLTGNCYNNMFNMCTNLRYIKCLATNISASNCTLYWTRYVSATGTFVKNPSMSSWTTGNNGIPSGWTVQDA